MQTVLLTKELAAQVRPRAGRVLLEVPRHSEIAREIAREVEEWRAFNLTEDLVMAKIYAPDTARDHAITETHQKARVLKVGYGPFYEGGEKYPGVTEDDFQPGDTVVFRPLLMELNQPYILTDVRRVDAKIVR